MSTADPATSMRIMVAHGVTIMVERGYRVKLVPRSANATRRTFDIVLSIFTMHVSALRRDQPLVRV